MSEDLDIYDASLRPAGTMNRDRVHSEGLWHQTFHCWIVDTSRRRILFQVRSENSKTHPGKFDITAAGHLLAGESVEDGVREVQEELGVEVAMAELVPAGLRVEVSDSPSGVKNREYQAVYFLPTTMRLQDMQPDPTEVAGIASLGIDDALALFAGRAESIQAEVVDTTSLGDLRTRGLATADFIPRIQSYYLAAAICAERLCDGKSEIAIS